MRLTQLGQEMRDTWPEGLVLSLCPYDDKVRDPWRVLSGYVSNRSPRRYSWITLSQRVWTQGLGEDSLAGINFSDLRNIRPKGYRE